MAFERFVKSKRSFKPKITLRGNGQIGLNLGAVELYGLSSYQYAVLFFDPERNLIGIKLTNEKEDGAAKLNVRQSSAAISGKAFLNYYRVPFSGKERFDIYQAIDGMLVTKEAVK